MKGLWQKRIQFISGQHFKAKNLIIFEERNDIESSNFVHRLFRTVVSCDAYYYYGMHCRGERHQLGLYGRSSAEALLYLYVYCVNCTSSTWASIVCILSRCRATM